MKYPMPLIVKHYEIEQVNLVFTRGADVHAPLKEKGAKRLRTKTIIFYPVQIDTFSSTYHGKQHRTCN